MNLAAIKLKFRQPGAFGKLARYLRQYGQQEGVPLFGQRKLDLRLYVAYLMRKPMNDGGAGGSGVELARKRVGRSGAAQIGRKNDRGREHNRRPRECEHIPLAPFKLEPGRSEEHTSEL